MHLVVQQVELAAVLPHEDVFERALADLTLQVLPDVAIDKRGLFAVCLLYTSPSPRD